MPKVHKAKIHAQIIKKRSKPHFLAYCAFYGEKQNAYTEKENPINHDELVKFYLEIKKRNVFIRISL